MSLSCECGNGFSFQTAISNCCISIGPKTSDNSIYTSSLSSVVDFIAAGMAMEAHGAGRAFIHVTGPRNVLVYKATGGENGRQCLLNSNFGGILFPNVCDFPFGKYIDQEEFILGLTNGFVPDENLSKLLQAASKVQIVTSVDHTDNGVSRFNATQQEIKMESAWQNPITLRPRRTFSEIEQPESPFVLRMHADENNHLSMALFEAGGKAWEHEAVQNIKAYLKKQLVLQDVTILA